MKWKKFPTLAVKLQAGFTVYQIALPVTKDCYGMKPAKVLQNSKQSLLQMGRFMNLKAKYRPHAMYVTTCHSHCGGQLSLYK